MSDARRWRADQDRMSVILPGTWANIPLDDPEAGEALIARLVKKQVGRDDRLATTRRDAKVQLLKLARDAREADAVQLAVSLELMPGLPFPASIMSVYKPWSESARESGLTLPQRLDRMAPGGEVLELESGIAIRSVEVVDIRVGESTQPDIKLEYHVLVPDASQLLQVVVDVPIESEPEPVVALFDAIVDSIRWFDQPNGTSAEAS
ncbi:hypothetical protein [Schumannella sp. 10F1B-5-1]|uniref:hypothetical protein n=1 Tax=Schumannella sp. 10F1B-5-1 TaxID=2590780 RepID=UPI00113147AE|nr:hypothetical protein [Schumannella sp. 10F1B-5-1]TPW72257.1 hypothetical protein FJ658_08265 [Schumannella sp. 10F1B-5-1]